MSKTFSLKDLIIQFGNSSGNAFGRIALLLLLLLATTACSGVMKSSDQAEATGELRGPSGYQVEYQFSWGNPTVKAAECVGSPGLGRVNLPFTISMRNLNGDRTVMLQQIATIDAWTNIPRSGTGLITDIKQALSESVSAPIEATDCDDLGEFNQVCGFYSTEALPPNGTCTTRAAITNIPEVIPLGAKIYFKLEYESRSGTGLNDCPQVLSISYPSVESEVIQLAYTSSNGRPTVADCTHLLGDATPSSSSAKNEAGQCSSPQELIDEVSPVEWKGKGFVGRQTIISADNSEILLFVDADPSSGVQTGFIGYFECVEGDWAPAPAMQKVYSDALNLSCRPYEVPPEFSAYSSEWCFDP
jgi:hypothetical protein